MLLGEHEAKGMCDKILAFAKADDASVAVDSEIYSHLRFGANAITTSGRREETNASVTVWINKQRGAASTNEINDAALRQMVEQAEQLARISPIDREYLPTLGAQQYRPTNGYREATANISLAERARVVGGMIDTCIKSNVIGAGFHQARGFANASATKNGNFSYHRASLVSVSLTARTPDGTGSGYFLRNHFDVARLDAARVAREAVRKALASRNARTLEPAAYTVILEPQAVADLLSFIADDFDARSADEGRSPFSATNGRTRVGEKAFDERINVYSDPFSAELPGSPIAQDGVPAQKLYLVRGGGIETLTYSRFWAQEKKTEPTPGPVNTIIESSAKPASIEEMIKSTDKGLLVSRFWYIRQVDPRTALFTGLTRDGVWYIEKGTIQFPVRNFRFNQSLLEMLAPGNVEMIGTPERVGSSEGQGRNASLLPALKVKRFNFTSQSEAV